MWAITSVSMPKGSPISENTDRKIIPSMISGIMMGSMEIMATASLSRLFLLYIPTAPMVPITAPHRQLKNARIRLFARASLISLSRNNSPYHFSENPPQTDEILDSLKE